VKLANYIALGLSLGEDLNRVVQRYVLPRLLDRVKEESYRSLLPDLLANLCRGLCVAICLAGFRYVNILVTSVRGAFTIVINLQHLFESRHIDVMTEESHTDFYPV